MGRMFLALALLAGGCTFRVSGFALPDGGMGGGEMGATDLAMPTPDLTGVDVGPGQDLAMVDMTAPFAPSHVDPSFYDPTADSLSGVTAIDTDAPSITPAPAQGTNIKIVHDSHGWAVLTVGAWTVDKAIKVTGSAPLVVVAAGAVIVNQTIDGSATHETPGPGGGGPHTGTGHGGNGSNQPLTFNDSGGGGAGYGTGGAQGGDSNAGAGSGGSAGTSYGGMLSDFAGGSGGGNGSGACSGNSGSGGGGGGAIQISSAVSITFAGGGKIHVGGGGGRGGCGSGDDSGGGGGSGGEIFLESPVITMNGVLAANGGGGGGGGTFVGPPGNSVDGKDGNDATPDDKVAPGGAAGGGNGGAGGAGGAASTGPTRGATAQNGGGSGGAVGVIWIHARQPPTIGGKVSPPPTVDSTL